MPEALARPPENTFRRKLNALWQDKRPWKTRLLLAAACSFAFFFTVLFFGPVELTVYNVYSLAFCVQEIWPMMAACTLLATAALALAISALRGKVYDTALCLLFALAAACYIQGTFLSGGDALTGDAIQWEDRLGRMLKNLLFWGLVVLAVFLLHYFSKRLWRKALCFGCALVVLMQSAGLVSMGIQGLYSRSMNDLRSYLSQEGLYAFSEQKNVLVILLDRMDRTYIQEILGQDPTFFDFLDGFTSYTNATAEFIRTNPGANAILTGYHEGAYQTPRFDYYNNSWDWDGRHLLHDLSDNGYTIDLYSQRSSLFANSGEADTYVRNAVPSNSSLTLSGVLKGLLVLSGYRYSPLAFKPFFWTDMDRINRTASPQADRYETDDIAFSNGLAGVAVTQEQPAFKFIHMNGSHSPFTIRSDGTPSDTVTTAAEQTAGCFCILKELFSRMKELGIYRDTAIIITADHGRPESDRDPLTEPLLIGLFYKPAGSEDTPLVISDAPASVMNIPATILKNTGADYSAYGLALDEVTEELQPVRYFFMPCTGEKGLAEEILCTYEIGVDATDFSSWEIVDRQPIAVPFWP